MPSRNTYHLIWVSLTLAVGYLFMAAPAKCSCYSLPWMRDIFSWPPLLTWMWSSSSQPSFREDLTPIPLKLFPKIEEGGTLPNTFSKATITLLLNRKGYHTKKLQVKSLVNIDAKILNKIQQTELKNSMSWSSGVYLRDARFLQYTRMNQCDMPY